MNAVANRLARTNPQVKTVTFISKAAGAEAR